MTMTKYNVLNAGSREVLNLDGPLTKDEAIAIAVEVQRDNDIDVEIVAVEEAE